MNLPATNFNFSLRKASLERQKKIKNCSSLKQNREKRVRNSLLEESLFYHLPWKSHLEYRAYNTHAKMGRGLSIELHSIAKTLPACSGPNHTPSWRRGPQKGSWLSWFGHRCQVQNSQGLPRTYAEASLLRINVSKHLDLISTTLNHATQKKTTGKTYILARIWMGPGTGVFGAL